MCLLIHLFASPPIRSVASSGPLLYVQTLISFTSISQQSTGLRKSRTVQVSHTAARVCHVNICHETREHMRAHTGSNKQQTHLHTWLKIPKINVNQIRYICCQNLIKLLSWSPVSVFRLNITLGTSFKEVLTLLSKGYRSAMGRLMKTIKLQEKSV